MTREKLQARIDKRIDEMQPGSVFVTSDFADIALTAAINMSFSRLEDSEKIRRILRGIYDKPRFSRLLNEPVAVDPSKVAYSIARKNRWSIIPILIARFFLQMSIYNFMRAVIISSRAFTFSDVHLDFQQTILLLRMKNFIKI